jgi:hypothetical protein
LPGSVPPDGAFVRRSVSPDGYPLDEVGRVIHAMDDTPDQTGVTSVVADFETNGIGVYGLDEVVVVDPPPTFRGQPVDR